MFVNYWNIIAGLQIHNVYFLNRCIVEYSLPQPVSLTTTYINRSSLDNLNLDHNDYRRNTVSLPDCLKAAFLMFLLRFLFLLCHSPVTEQHVVLVVIVGPECSHRGLIPQAKVNPSPLLVEGRHKGESKGETVHQIFTGPGDVLCQEVKVVGPRVQRGSDVYGFIEGDVEDPNHSFQYCRPW